MPLSDLVNFGNHIRKPGWFLGHDVYEYQPENGDWNHHVNYSQDNEKNEDLGLNAHMIEFSLSSGSSDAAGRSRGVTSDLNRSIYSNLRSKSLTEIKTRRDEMLVRILNMIDPPGIWIIFPLKVQERMLPIKKRSVLILGRSTSPHC
jgi:hypothetical protein